MLQRERIISSLVFLRRLGVGTVTLYVIVSLSLGGTRPARPVFQAAAAIWLALCVLLQARPLAAPHFLRRLELVLTNVVLTLVFGEVALHVLGACTGHSLLTAHTLDAHRLKPGHDYGSGLCGNRQGYPGRDVPHEKPAGTFRIAALGDSMALGPAVPFADNYLTLLEEKLPGTMVCNFGISGAGPREYHAILERDVWPVQPDLVLVSIFVGNDITEMLPTPRYLDPRRHALYLLCTRGWRLLQERQRYDPAQLVTAPRPTSLAPATFREVEARRLAICLPSAAKPLESKWQRALGHLEQIVRACRQRNVPVAFVLIPDEFQVNPSVRTQALSDAQLTADPIDLDLPQRRFREFCEQQRVPCLDLLPAFRGRPNTYAPNDTHWNTAGNRLAATTIAGWLGEAFETLRPDPRIDRR